MAGLAAVLGALERVREALGSPAALQRVGSQYALAADAHPGMFSRGRAYQDDLSRQFGVGPILDIKPEERSALQYWSRYRIPVKGQASLMDPAQLIAEVKSRDELMPRAAGAYEDIRALDRGGLLSGGADYHIFDTVGLRQNSGQGTQLYAAAFGNLLRHPNSVNVSEALSMANKLRRTNNQSAAILRDPRLSERIVISPSQITEREQAHPGAAVKKTPPPFSGRRFHALSPEGQVGALQLLSARNALKNLSYVHAVDEDKVLHPDVLDPTESEKLMRRRNSVLGLEHYSPRALEGDYSLPALQGLSRAYQASPRAPSYPMGDRTMRQLRATLQALHGDLADLPRGALDDYFYCGGGRVKRPRRT